jgi:bifunctional non-homologous end joining protein LigD
VLVSSSENSSAPRAPLACCVCSAARRSERRIFPLAHTMVFDLDPSEGLNWTFVMDTALTLRELLEQAGYESWPKLTGGKGIHLMVPLTARMTHDAAHRRSRFIAERLVETDPDRLTVSAAFAERSGRLFVDYLRNGRGTTAVGTYSPRARAGHPIAAPVTWKGIEAGIRPDAFMMRHPPALPTERPRRKR